MEGFICQCYCNLCFFLFIRKIFHINADFSFPSIFILMRFKMDIFQINILNLLQNYRPVKASVGIIIIGNMKGRFFTEAVVYLHPNHMLSWLYVHNDTEKGSKCIIMVHNKFIIKIYICRMAYPFKFQSNIGLFLNINFSGISSLASVIQEFWILLPAPRYGNPVFCTFLCSKTPYAVQFPLLPDVVLLK